MHAHRSRRRRRAAKLAAEHAEYLEAKGNSGDYYLLAYYKSLAKPHAALSAYQRALAGKTTPYTIPTLAILVALEADKLGKAKFRDKALEMLDRDYEDSVRQELEKMAVFKLGKWLQRAYQGDEDPAALDEVFKDGTPDGEADAAYLLACYFKQHNKPELARQYVDRALATKARYRWTYTTACVLSRELPPAADSQAEPEKEKPNE